MKKWLEEIRKRQGLTTYTVASNAGISQSYYSAIENGSRGCPVPTAKKIAAALGFDWKRFYEDEEGGSNACETEKCMKESSDKPQDAY